MIVTFARAAGESVSHTAAGVNDSSTPISAN
jgi:hypothetical protein